MTDLGLSARLPHEPDIERRVLAGLLSHGCWAELPPGMSDAAFVLAEHADVFRLGLEEHRAGRLATGPALLARCTNGIRATLKDLVAYPGLRTDVIGLAPALVELQLRRDMIALGSQIEALGLDMRPGESAVGNLALAVERAQELRARFPGEAAAEDWRAQVKRLDLATLDAEPIPVRRYVIQEWAGEGWPIAITGLGGRGKTTVAQTATTCVAAGLMFFGNAVVQRNAAVLTGEESLEDLHIRQCAINAHFGLSFATLAGKLELMSFRGEDMTCFSINPKSGTVETTALWQRVRQIVLDTNSGFTFLDHWGLMVAGPEGDRHATGIVFSIAAGLADEVHGVLAFAQHPSKAPGAEYSGNTGFDGGVRARWTLDAVADDKDDPRARRILKIGKANYSAEAAIELEWRAGLFVPVNEQIMSPVRLMQVRAHQNEAKEVFLSKLVALTTQQRAVSEKPRAGNYAPRLMAGDGFTEKELAKAMHELFDEGRIMANVALPWKLENRHAACGIACVALRSEP